MELLDKLHDLLGILMDEKTSDMVFDALLSLVELSGMAALIATHNENLAKKMNRRISLKSGKLFSD